jgi:hypothetical protein
MIALVRWQTSFRGLKIEVDAADVVTRRMNAVGENVLLGLFQPEGKPRVKIIVIISEQQASVCSGRGKSGRGGDARS